MCWSYFCTTMFLWKQSVQGRWRTVCSGLCISAFPKWRQMVAEGSEDVCPFEIVNNSDERALHRTWWKVQARISLKKKIRFFSSAAKPTQSILLSKSSKQSNTEMDHALQMKSCLLVYAVSTKPYCIRKHLTSISRFICASWLSYLMTSSEMKITAVVVVEWELQCTELLGLKVFWEGCCYDRQTASNDVFFLNDIRSFILHYGQ